MAVLQIAFVVLLSCLVSTVLSYDKDIKVADLSACSEVIFDEGAKYFITQHIDRFKYNSARPDEWLRMRMYYMGADGPHIGFSERARLDEERALILGKSEESPHLTNKHYHIIYTIGKRPHYVLYYNQFVFNFSHWIPYIQSIELLHATRKLFI